MPPFKVAVTQDLRVKAGQHFSGTTARKDMCISRFWPSSAALLEQNDRIQLNRYCYTNGLDVDVPVLHFMLESVTRREKSETDLETISATAEFIKKCLCH